MEIAQDEARILRSLAMAFLESIADGRDVVAPEYVGDVFAEWVEYSRHDPVVQELTAKWRARTTPPPNRAERRKKR